MSHVSNREIASMSAEARDARLLELQEELLQLRAEKALGGTPSNMGAYKATREIVQKELGLTGQKLEDYLQINFSNAWEHYDVLNNDMVEVEQMSSFMKMVLKDYTA